jgi:carbamoyl-phosphate synthase large subunit
MGEAVEASEDRPILVDQYLDGAIEVDVDCLSDGTDSVIGAIMEHVELAGIHSGDSACMIPPANLSAEAEATIREYTFSMANELNVCGLMNVQYAVKNDEVYVIEVNPRASRTVPFVSKAIGVPLAKLAALVMTGRTLADLGFTSQIVPDHHSVKEAVFPFNRFPGIDVILTPEMKSTGEVMGIDPKSGIAFLKSQAAAGNTLPESGNVFISVRDNDKSGLVDLVKTLCTLGYAIHATRGTHELLKQHGIESALVMKISEGHPNAIDLIEDSALRWIVNTPSEGAIQRHDEIKMRAHAVLRGVPITTTVDGLRAAVNGLSTLHETRHMNVCTLQEYHQAIQS